MGAEKTSCVPVSFLPENCSTALTSWGRYLTHGPHQVAQKPSATTPFPLWVDRSIVPPFRRSSFKGGAAGRPTGAEPSHGRANRRRATPPSQHPQAVRT